jgi:hypothetical protein
MRANEQEEACIMMRGDRKRVPGREAAEAVNDSGVADVKAAVKGFGEGECVGEEGVGVGK